MSNKTPKTAGELPANTVSPAVNLSEAAPMAPDLPLKHI